MIPSLFSTFRAPRLFVTGLLGLLFTLPAFAQERALVRVANPLATMRADEVVTVPWAALEAQMNNLEATQVRVRESGAEGEAVPMQVLDADEDGRPDELLLLASFRPEERRTFVVEAAAPTQETESRVHVAHEARRDDIAWENERVAFRTYGQGLHELEDLVSSGIDVWLKRVRKLVVDEWYAEGHYHTDTGEGADFFSVGPTLGAGGTALWHEGRLHRAPNFADYRIVANGPLRAVVELEYGPWEAAGLQVTEQKRITIDAGDYAFRSESTFRTQSGADSLTYATGLVKRPEVVAAMRQEQPWGWFSLWGPVESGSGGHGDLGTAVLLPQEQVRDVRTAEGHYLALMKGATGQPVRHYVATGWTAAEAFNGVRDWWAYLSDFAHELEVPLKVEVVSAESP